MLHNWIRVFYSDNGTLADYSLEAQTNGETVPASLVTGEDFIYVGQYFPFNNVYFEPLAVNDNASVMRVDYWDGRAWRAGVDVIDATKSQGKTLARAGVIQFSPDIDFSWSRVSDTTKNGEPPELSSLEIYDLFWARFKVSASLTTTTTLRKVGYSFTTGEMLTAIDPEINEYLVPWGGVSKTSWAEQIQLASMHVVADLKSKGLIVAPGNILRFDDVSLPCAYRTLAVIYSRLGEAFAARKDDALKQYGELLNIQRFTLDRDNNARVDRSEIANVVGGLVR